jgi:hypothetical protein
MYMTLCITSNQLLQYCNVFLTIGGGGVYIYETTSYALSLYRCLYVFLYRYPNYRNTNNTRNLWICTMNSNSESDICRNLCRDTTVRCSYSWDICTGIHINNDIMIKHTRSSRKCILHLHRPTQALQHYVIKFVSDMSVVFSWYPGFLHQ